MKIKKVAKNILKIDRRGIKESKKIIRKIKDYSVVTFDIFDTLVKRDVPEEIVVFEILQKKLIEHKLIDSETDFVKMRIQAELDARRCSINSEVSLEEIYAHLSFITPEYKKKILQMEEKIEIDICTVNPLIKPVYDYCIKNGLEIYIISDMYLRSEILEKILSKCGYTDYKKLYVSCEYGCSKRGGKLYPLFLKKEKLEAKRIIHIGDDLKADILQASKYGINVCKIPKLVLKDSYFCMEGLNKSEKEQYKILQAFIDNRKNEGMNRYEQIGYEVFGPLLYGFSEWISENIEKESKLYFVSRDGYVVKKAFEIIQKKKRLPVISRYFYISRRSLYLPALNGRCTLENAMKYISVHKTTKADVVFERFGISKQEFYKVAQCLKIDPEKTYVRQELKSNQDVNRVFEFLRNELENNACTEYKAMNEYFKTQDFTGKVVLVDIGWRGSIQKALEDLDQSDLYNPFKIRELYLAIRHDAMVKPDTAKGYLVNFEKNNTMLESFAAFNAIIEMFFSAPHGSVNKYVLDSDNHVSIDFDEYEYCSDIPKEKEAAEIIGELQSGALRFVEDFCKSILSDNTFSSKVAYQNLLNFGTMAKKKDAEVFGDFPYHDTEVQPIARPESILYYFFHPQRFKYDFATSAWRVAFLKRLFKIRLPYYRLFCILYRKTR